MIPKPIATGIVFSSIVFATASTQAQVGVDVSKITCDQFVHDKIPIPSSTSFSFSAVGSKEAQPMLSRWLITAWLGGYYNAKRNNRIVDLETFEDKVNKVTNYCYDEKNWKVPVMKAVEQVLGGSK
jgi:hypothetical protein